MKYTITHGSEYYNTVHCAWFPVPVHWIGTDARLLTHRVKIN